MPKVDFNAKPEGLSPAGERAYEAIMKVLRAHEATETGGCTSFYSPEQWKDRGEEYGRNAELIVVYDGGDLGQFFSLGHSYPSYKTYEVMRKALETAGLYFEECTGWYAAVYPLR